MATEKPNQKKKGKTTTTKFISLFPFKNLNSPKLTINLINYPAFSGTSHISFLVFLSNETHTNLNTRTSNKQRSKQIEQEVNRYSEISVTANKINLNF